MKTVIKTAWIILICSLLGNGLALANAPTNLGVIVFGIPMTRENLISGKEHDELCEAIEKINGLDVNEANVVLFDRVAESGKEPALPEKLIQEWAGLLQIQVSKNMPEVAALRQEHDLDAVSSGSHEAELVFLVRRTPPQKVDSAAKLLRAYFNKLADKLIAKNKNN